MAGHGPRHHASAQVESDTSLVLLLGLGTTAGIAAMALVLWPAITRAEHPGALALRRCATRPCGRSPRLSGWTLGYVVVNQITLFVIISLAFGTPGGAGVSAWTYAYQFFQLPYGVFTVSVMTAFTPELASLATERALAAVPGPVPLRPAPGDAGAAAVDGGASCCWLARS